jgi:hypothetical protein
MTHSSISSSGLETRRNRLRHALWGLFAGDALGMPAHWIYTRTTPKEVFPGGIRTYLDPTDPHPESFMFKMAYNPDPESAVRLGRPFDSTFSIVTHSFSKAIMNPQASRRRGGITAPAASIPIRGSAITIITA